MQAKNKKPYMKKLDISWDLKPDKKVTFQSYREALGYRDHTITIKNYNVKKKGAYKKLSFSVVVDAHVLSQQEVHDIYAWREEMVNDIGFYVGTTGIPCYYTLVDYSTGKCLESKNDKNVVVKATGWEMRGLQICNDSDGCSLMEPKGSQVKKVTVIYPADYKDLCIVAGGYSEDGDSNDDFWEGKVKFGKTTMISPQNSRLAHAMRVK